MINEETQTEVLARLKKIEGQVKGLARMVENGEYCIHLCDQANAIRRALESVTLIIMRRHVESCVADSVKVGGGREKLDELISAIDRFIR